MIIECIGNRPAYLSEPQRKHVIKNAHVDSFLLSIGKKYIVHGVILRDGSPWYLIIEQKDSEYPTPHYAGFFKIMDDVIPIGWCFKWGSGPWPEGSFLPVRWSAPNFFEKLLDGDKDALKTFRDEAHMLE